MSYADVKFKELVEKIASEGQNTENEPLFTPRAKWPDGSPAHYVAIFNSTTEYDLQKEFPAITFRRTALKTCMDEILWIYQRKSNKLADLNAHIWDEWGDENGTIGKAYGYQIAKKADYGKLGMMDQTDRVLWQLKNTPFDRGILFNIFYPAELPEMRLRPCAYSFILNVNGKKDGKLVLNGMLLQRSQDTLAANNWNVCQYAILLMMLAQVNDMVPGRLVHCVSDAHLYDKHVQPALDLVKREQYPAPKVWLNPDIKNFYDFQTSDLHVENYQHGEQIKIPIAI